MALRDLPMRYRPHSITSRPPKQDAAGNQQRITSTSAPAFLPQLQWGSGRCGRSVRGSAPGWYGSGYLVDDKVAVRLVGHQAPKVRRGEDIDDEGARALRANEPVPRLAVVAQGS